MNKRSLIQLERGEVIDTQFLCAFSYANGRLALVMCSGDRFECRMDEKRGHYWINRLCAERGGASQAIAQNVSKLETAEPKSQSEPELAEVIP